MLLEGFEGDIVLGDIMRECNWGILPEKKGVYAIISPLDFIRDDFIIERGGSYQGKYPNYAISKLEKKWIDNTNIIYIGKAGGKDRKTGKNQESTLQSRIKAYLSFGLGKKYSHGGGRSIWQLSKANVSQLHLIWRICADGEEPVELERDLLNQFKVEYGKFPFANKV